MPQMHSYYPQCFLPSVSASHCLKQPLSIFYFLSKLYQTDHRSAFMPTSPFLEQSESVQGYNRPAWWTWTFAWSVPGTSQILSLHVGMDVFAVLAREKSNFQDRTCWKNKFFELSVSFNSVPNIFIENEVII